MASDNSMENKESFILEVSDSGVKNTLKVIKTLYSVGGLKSILKGSVR